MIIAFTGRKHCGKTTIALALAERIGAGRVRFAGPFKDALMAMGLTRAQVDGDEKDTPCALLGGKTPRFAMKTLGTEWGRDHISKSIWVDLAMARADAATANGCDVVMDDLRFPNEARAVLDRGGAVIELRRGDAPNEDTHASEAGIPATLITVTIPNNSGVADAVRCLVRFGESALAPGFRLAALLQCRDNDM